MPGEVTKTVPPGNSLSNSLSKGWLGALNFVFILTALVSYIVPRTALSWPFENFSLRFLPVQDLYSSQGGFELRSAALHFVVWLHLGLLAYYCILRFAFRSLSGPTTRFLDSLAVLGFLYAVHPFVTSRQSLPIIDFYWPYWSAILFFASIIGLNRSRALLVVQWVAILIATQSLYAIIYYALGVAQFYTPNFGNRTAGTFSNPSVLYPLCLLGVPFCWCLSQMAHTTDMRWFWRISGGLTLCALILTFMRTGWIALAMALFYLATTPRASLHHSLRWRRFLLTLGLFLILGALTLRTHGSLPGNEKDRSTLGRLAIWRVAVLVWEEHPWVGGGVGSYEMSQRRHMTPRLASFNPMNNDPKSLYLQVADEFGALGLVLFFICAWQYILYYRSTVKIDDDNEIANITCGLHSAIIAISMAGLSDSPILNNDKVPSTVALSVLLAATFALVQLPKSTFEFVAAEHVKEA